MLVDVSKKHFEDEDSDLLHAHPLYFSSISPPSSGKGGSYSGGEEAYLPVPDEEWLRTELSQALAAYNENHAIMELVLFREAMEHTLRIARIIRQPGGSALWLV